MVKQKRGCATGNSRKQTSTLVTFSVTVRENGPSTSAAVVRRARWITTSGRARGRDKIADPGGIFPSRRPFHAGRDIDSVWPHLPNRLFDIFRSQAASYDHMEVRMFLNEFAPSLPVKRLPGSPKSTLSL